MLFSTRLTLSSLDLSLLRFTVSVLLFVCLFKYSSGFALQSVKQGPEQTFVETDTNEAEKETQSRAAEQKQNPQTLLK